MGGMAAGAPAPVVGRGFAAVLRRFQTPAAWPLCAGALMAVLAFGGAQVRAQSPNALDQFLKQPSLDGDPLIPPRFRRPGSNAREPDPTRFGAMANFGYQPARGAGASGFDSTGKRKPKTAAKAKAVTAAKAAPASRTPTDAAGRPELGPSSAAGAVAVGQPIGAARLPQNRERRGAPPGGVFATGVVPDQFTPLRRFPIVGDNPFDPVGINAGAFRLRPAVGVSGGYDSLPTRTVGGRASWFTVVAPELSVNSLWPRHELTAAVRSSYIDYDAVPSLSRPAVDARVTGRVDVTRDTRLNLEGDFILGTDNPGSPNIQSDLRRLPLYTTVGGFAGIAQRFNRLDVSFKAIAERTVYQPSTFIDGSTASNDDRTYDRFGSELRASYELTPGVKPFVELGADQRVHDLAVDRSGLMRDSQGRYAKAGTTFELTRLLTGEMSLGYLTRHYKDPTLPDLGGLLVDGGLTWAATPLTTFKLAGKTTVGETTLAGVSGILSREVGVEVAHAFRRWLILTLRGTAGFDQYKGFPREDERFAASAALAYALNRDLQFKSELRQEWRHSNLPGFDYSASVVLFGLRLQR